MLLRKVLQGLVTLVLAKCENKIPASLRSSRVKLHGYIPGEFDAAH